MGLTRGIVLSAAIAVAGCSADPPLDVAPNVDLSRFQGKWFEIAKLPRPTQTDCYGTAAYYSLASSDSLVLVNQCNVGSMAGALRTVTMNAKVTSPSAPGKLAIDVGGFYGDYWILELGPRYEYAVIGHPSRSYLWILSRTPTLDDPTLQGILSRARAKQFDTSRIEMTPQSP
jgi:apolipoprotein D and lipocalin family protein